MSVDALTWGLLVVTARLYGAADPDMIAREILREYGGYVMDRQTVSQTLQAVEEKCRTQNTELSPKNRPSTPRSLWE